MEMVHSPIKAKCKLKQAYLEEHGNHHNFTIVLSGHEAALASANRIITDSIKNCYVERDSEHNTLRIVAALPKENSFQAAVDFTQMLQGITDFHLSHIYMTPDYEQVGHGEKAVYTPVITIHPVVKAEDPDNIAGAVSAQVIKGNKPLMGYYVQDPRHQGANLRLMSVKDGCETDTEALAHAEANIRTMEKEVGVFTAQPTHLTLSELRTQTMRDPEHKGHLKVTTARLKGAPDELDDALRTLRHRHRNLIAELGRGDDYIDVGTAAKHDIDPTGLLAALHLTTGCELPMDIRPTVIRDKGEPYGYTPILETRVRGDETGLEKPTMRFATARYAGSYIHDAHTVPEEMDPHTPSQIVMLKEHTTEEAAQHVADLLAERIRARLHGESQGRQQS
jgi:hypothetical protein